MASELICPITHELPIDPVVANDGIVYEREAIAKWIETCAQKGCNLTSPMSAFVMSAELTKVPQVRKCIEALVENGNVDGEEAVTWKQKKQLVELEEKALKGDVRSIVCLAQRYDNGTCGTEVDHVKARELLQRLQKWCVLSVKCRDRQPTVATVAYNFAVNLINYEPRHIKRGLCAMLAAAELDLDCAWHALFVMHKTPACRKTIDICIAEKRMPRLNLRTLLQNALNATHKSLATKRMSAEWRRAVAEDFGPRTRSCKRKKLE